MLLYAILLCSAIALWVIIDHERSKDHHLSSDLVDLPSDFNTQLLSPHEVQSICRSNGFAVHKTSTKSKKRKVYDLVLMSTELHWLEIRLHTLADQVDYFVIIESPTTFTSKPKPLHLRENWSQFAAFHHKIIYRVVSDPIQSSRIWDHEDFFRNALFTHVFPDLIGTPQEANRDDVLVVSDMDEIPRPGTLALLRLCEFPLRLTLRSEFYYYSFQWRHRGPQWAHPDATLYRGAQTLLPNDLRQGLLPPSASNGIYPYLTTPVASLRRHFACATLHNAAWHCLSCFSTLVEVRSKMESFSHQGWNTAANRDRGTVVERVRQGLDLFGREGEVMSGWWGMGICRGLLGASLRGWGGLGGWLSGMGLGVGFWMLLMMFEVEVGTAGVDVGVGVDDVGVGAEEGGFSRRILMGES
jgi:beta-1,4-mannosyl-glycoprotein beta-1,4-N-acetylglucosaminyltransferase